MMDVIATSSKDVGAEIDNKENRNVDNDDDKDNLFDELEKFVPTPEYGENESRWTLKHREPSPGLVELIKHSGVYVNADKLDECQKWSNDCKMFAGKLLTEIFTISALSTCSWSELDKHATNILLQFVVGYGQIRHWMGTDYQCILKAIRQVMLELKRARKRKEENVESKSSNENTPHKRKFVPPPEYDKNNSRWTLKYREYAPGLVEIIKDSCVYVEVSKLAKCKRKSDDGVTLARLLLPEIFTASALSTCSVTSTGDGTNIRPKLDENAITTLLKLVEMENGWLVTDKKSILNSIRQKMEVLRRVKTIEGKEEERGNELLKKNLSEECKLRLPPEYDENDSRWTLKYREPAPGLVELMDNSGVYVEDDRLAKCKKLSNDCQTLAQKLLTEIFTTNALTTCSFSRKNRECYYYKPCPPDFVPLFGFSKPELDAHAEIILLNFVDEYALEKGWTILDFQLIRVSMISRIHEVCKEYRESERRRKFELAGV